MQIFNHTTVGQDIKDICLYLSSIVEQYTETTMKSMTYLCVTEQELIFTLQRPKCMEVRYVKKA